MKKYILFTILLLLSPPSIASGEEFSVKGMSLGMGTDSLKGEGKMSCFKDADNATTEVCKLIVDKDSQFSTLAGAKVSYILVHLHNAKIVRFYVATNLEFTTDYEITMEAFTNKYGKPKELSDYRAKHPYGWRLSELRSGHQLNGESHYKEINQFMWVKGEQSLVVGSIIPSDATYESSIGDRPEYYPYAPRDSMSSSDLIKPRGAVLLVDSAKYSAAVKIYSNEVADFKKKKKDDAAAAKKAKVANDL